MTPLSFFIGTWFILLLLYNFDEILFNLFDYKISIHAHLYRLASLLMFTLGTLIIWILFQKFKSNNNSEFNTGEYEEITKVLLFLFAIGTIIRIIIIIKTYGLSIAVSLPLIRADYVSGLLKFPFFTSSITIFANIIALNLGLLYGIGKKVGKLIIIFVTLAILDDATMGDKAGLRLIIMIIMSAYYSKRIILEQKFTGVGKIIMFAFITLSAYSVITFFRVNGQSANIMEITFSHFYASIVGNLPSSAYFLNHPWPNDSFGAYSFSGFYDLFGIKYTQDHSLSQVSGSFFDANITSSGSIFNVTDFIAYLNSDFGLLGILIVSLLLGIISSFTFLYAKYKKSYLAIAYLAYLVTSLIICFRGFYFGAPGFLMTIVLLPLLNKLIKFMRSIRKKKLKEQTDIYENTQLEITSNI